VCSSDLALDLLETATTPRITWQSPLEWSNDPDWKLDYSNIERVPAKEVTKLRAEFDRQKLIAKTKRQNDENKKDQVT